MKIGIMAPLGSPFATPEYIVTLGTEAEARGFTSLWVPEHVVLFDEYASKYPYSSDGRLAAPPDVGPLEPFTALAFLASHTRTIRLGTGVCLVPQRNPVYTAKEVACLDWLSNGRVDFGVGVGWLAEEFAALGVPFERRGARAREYIEVMRRLWCDPSSEYHGEFYDLPPCRQYPKPLQQPHPPVHFGGESDPALKRVADLGQGWYGFNLDPDRTRERLARLDALLADRGRNRSEVAISISPPWSQPVTLDQVEQFRALGVDQVIVTVLSASPDDLRQALDYYAVTLVEPSREELSRGRRP